MTDLFDLTGKKAIVTGGAKGIGKAIVEGLHDHGAEVAILDITSDAQNVAEELSKSGPRVMSFTVDLGDRGMLKESFNEAIQMLGTLDILVNAAGILISAPSVEYPLSSWDKTIEINLTSVFEMCQLAGTVMIPKGEGKIVNIGSYNSIAGTEGLPSYCASKGGLKLLSMTLAAEWAGSGVYVNTVAPGYVETELSRGLRSDPEGYQKSLETIPLARWGRPDDIKGPVLFLASKASDYVTGISLIVDGGRLSK